MEKSFRFSRFLFSGFDGFPVSGVPVLRFTVFRCSYDYDSFFVKERIRSPAFRFPSLRSSGVPVDKYFFFFLFSSVSYTRGKKETAWGPRGLLASCVGDGEQEEEEEEEEKERS